jgi:hypothetical protein
MRHAPPPSPSVLEKARKFQLFDEVTWDDTMGIDRVNSMRAQYGEGPFEVISIGASDGLSIIIAVDLGTRGRQSFAAEWFKLVSRP